MKLIKRILLIVLVVSLVLFVTKDIVAKIVIENGVGLATGLKLKMDKFKFSLSQSYVGIEDMRLYNPRGFPDKVMADIPEIFVDYKLADLMAGKVHLEDIRFHLKEFTVVKNKDGELNLDALKPVQQEKKPKPKEEKPKKDKAPKIQIDNMALRVEKVVFKDYTKGGKPSVKEFPINLNERYQNITNPNQLVALIVVKVMMHTPIAALANFDLGGLQDSVAGTLASSQKLAADAAAKAQEAAAMATEKAAQASEAVLDKTKDAQRMLDTASDSLKEGTGALRSTAKGLTGGLKDATTGLKDKVRLP